MRKRMLPKILKEIYEESRDFQKGTDKVDILSSGG